MRGPLSFFPLVGFDRRCGADCFTGPLRGGTVCLPRLGDERLDLLPNHELVLVGPESAHLRERVTRNHAPMFAGSPDDLDQNGAMRRFSIDQARRIALAAQGLTRSRPVGRIDVRHFRRVLAHIGVVQLDSVNVLARAHYMPFFSRLGPYDQEALDRWLWGSREMFEYWGHAASVMPIDDRPLMAHRMRGGKPWRSIERLIENKPGFIEALREEVRQRGPLTLSELNATTKRSDPWWGWTDEKHALEWLFFKGELAAADRVNFSKAYDIPERVHGRAVLEADGVDERPARSRLLMRAAKSLGVATLADLADYYRIRVQVARPLVEDLVRAGALERVEVERWQEDAYLHPSAAMPHHHRGASLLSPFDPLIWFRPRVERLFGFEYRIEIYVPADKRLYGYYVLPFLFDGELVGRVDLKADRKRGVLSVKASHIEDGHDAGAVAFALAGELQTITGWLDLVDIEVDEKGNLARTLGSKL